jgi:hypothetical protein
MINKRIKEQIDEVKIIEFYCSEINSRFFKVQVKNNRNVVVIHQVDHPYPMIIRMNINEKNNDHLPKKEKKVVSRIS